MLWNAVVFSVNMNMTHGKISKPQHFEPETSSQQDVTSLSPFCLACFLLTLSLLCLSSGFNVIYKEKRGIYTDKFLYPTTLNLKHRKTKVYNMKYKKMTYSKCTIFVFSAGLVHEELHCQPEPSCPWVGWATAWSGWTQRTKTLLSLFRMWATLCLEVSNCIWF